MRGALLTAIPTDALELHELETPELPTEAALIAVDACGVCGTDLHIMEGRSYRPELPLVLGHEAVGRVVEAAGGHARELLGKRVAVYPFVGCGSCEPCRRGDTRLCETGARVAGVLGLSGGFADQMVALPSQLVPVPPELSAVEAATLVDAGTTAHNAVRVLYEALPPAAGSVLVVGAGPVGLLVAELLRTHDFDVSLVETSPRRAEEARRLGHEATESVTATGASFAAVVDCAAAPAVVMDELAALRPQGWYIAVGYSVVPQLDLSVVARRELTVRGIRSGTVDDLSSIMDLAASRRIRLPRPVVFSLRAINGALASLRAGSVPGKVVISTSEEPAIAPPPVAMAG